MRENYKIKLDKPDPYAIAALIISSWACPGVKEGELRGRLYHSLCAWFLRDRREHDPDWAAQPQWLRPDQACRAETDIRRDFRTLERRIKDRVTAGRMAIPFLLEVETGIPTPGLTLIQQAEWVAAERGIADPENVMARVWTPSRRVIHLSAAWAVIAQEHFKEHGTQFDVYEVMRRPEFLAPLLYRAQLMEPLVVGSRLRISADELIGFHLVTREGVKITGIS